PVEGGPPERPAIPHAPLGARHRLCLLLCLVLGHVRRAARHQQSHSQPEPDDRAPPTHGWAPHFSVSMRPLMNQRCISTTIAIGGSIAMTTVAITRFHSAAASPVGTTRLMPMTTVDIVSSVVTRRGHRYWFQPKMNRMTKSAARFVFDKGARI